MLKFKLNSTYLLLAFGCVFSMTLANCKKDKKDEFPVQANVYTRYLQDNGQINSIITFVYMDSVAMGQRDTTKYAVMINDKDYKQTFSQIEGLKYVYAGTLPFNNEFNIRVKKPSGEIMNQTMPFASIDSLSQPIEISLTQPNQISWHGQPLKDDEQIIILITTDKNKTISATINGPSTEQNLILTQDQLAGLETGQASLYLVRSSNWSDKKDLYEFVYKTEFFSKTYNIQIKQ